MAVTAADVVAPFIPLEWQIAPWKDKAHTLLLTGAAGGGKSKLAAEKVNAYCWKYPGATAVLLRKAQEWTRKSVIPFMWQSVMGMDRRIKYNVQDGTFKYPNGSMIYSGGLRNNDQRESLRSIGGEGGLDIVWMEEGNAFSRQDYEEVIARVRHTAADWQQIIITTNPDAPSHWINLDLILGGEGRVYYSSAVENPYNSAGYLDNLERLTGMMYDRMVLGKWVQAEGAVYADFDPQVHVVDSYTTSKYNRRIRVVDFGFTNPFVCQWWEIDGDGRMFLYREIYKTRGLVEDFTTEITRLSRNEVIETTIADHDAEDRATMERHGITTIPAIKDVTSGIQEVNARWRVQPDGRARIFFLRGALVEVDPELESAKKPTNTIEEIPGYSWPKGVDGKPIKEEPLKINDHGCDAARYAAMYEANKDSIWWMT